MERILEDWRGLERILEVLEVLEILEVLEDWRGFLEDWRMELDRNFGVHPHWMAIPNA